MPITASTRPISALNPSASKGKTNVIKRQMSAGTSANPVCIKYTTQAGINASEENKNAIAYNPKTGLVDPFGGQDDIKSKTLRCVGKPTERFEEDSLRILRGLRFASVLSFNIDKDTESAMHSCKDLINIVSPERIYVEITKLLCGQSAGKILSLYSYIRLSCFRKKSSTFFS